MRKSLGRTKPKGESKRKGTASNAGLGRIPSAAGVGRTTGPSVSRCRRGGARAYTLVPERW